MFKHLKYQLVSVFWKAVEPLEQTVQLGEVGLWEWALKVMCVSASSLSQMLPDLPRCEELQLRVLTTVVLVQHDGLVLLKR